MATTKVTFTLDSANIERPRDAADRLALPKSAVVRETISDYDDRSGRLSERGAEQDAARSTNSYRRFLCEPPGMPIALQCDAREGLEDGGRLNQ